MINEIAQARNNLIVKDNELIRKARYNLSVNQQKIIAYLISKIKPTDKELTIYKISIKEFCLLCGIDDNHFYSEIKEIVDNLDNKTFWVDTEEKLFKFRWFSEVEIIKKSGEINIQLNSNIKKYLIDLKKDFTQYELYNILALKSKYSIRLYEWFKSYCFTKKKIIDIKELKYILEAEHYKNFKDFRKRVLSKAIAEINLYTDLETKYEPVYKGKKVVSLIFYIKLKEPLDRYSSYLNTVEVLDKYNGTIKGQLTIYDI